MKIIYVAGPYTGTPWEIHRNIYRAQAAGITIAELGAMPLIPHSNTPACFTGTQSPEFWYDGTMALLRRSDAVLLIEGWQASKGACREKIQAEKLGLPVFTELPKLDAWINE